MLAVRMQGWRFVLGLLALFFATSSAVAASSNSGPDKSAIKLIFLGTGSPRPSETRYGASVLVELDNGKRLLVDAGSGARERLFSAGGFDAITSVDTILVTHLHYDHTVSIPDLWITGWLYGRRTPMTIFGPEGVKDMAQHFEKAYSWDLDMRNAVGLSLEGAALRAHDISPGVILDRDGLKITAFNVEHMPVNVRTGEKIKFRGATYGFRIDYKGRAVVFSGDTRSEPGTDLIKYGQGADVLIHEVQVPSKGDSAEAKRANISLVVHSTPAQAAYVFDQTKPRLAVYSHIIPPDTTAEELAEETRPGYQGALATAHDLMTITIGDEIVIGDTAHEGHHVFEGLGVVK